MTAHQPGPPRPVPPPPGPMPPGPPGPPPPGPPPQRPVPPYPGPQRPGPQRPDQAWPAPPLPSPGGSILYPAQPGRPDPVLDRLLDERVVYLGRDLDDATAERVIPQLLLLAALDPRRDVSLHLHALGGTATATLAVYDTLRTAGPDVATRAVGLVGAPGALLLAAGTPGRRQVAPHARVLLRHPSAGVAVVGDTGIGGQLRQQVVTLLARHSGRPDEAVEADLAAGRWLTAPEAVEYGLADAVIEA